MKQHEIDIVIDAWSSLECALSQQAPSDDKIIMDLVRDAAATLNVLRKLPLDQPLAEMVNDYAIIEPLVPGGSGWQCTDARRDGNEITEYGITDAQAFLCWLGAVVERREELEAANSG